MLSSPNTLIYLSLFMSGNLGSLSVGSCWWAERVRLDFSVVCFLVCDMWLPALQSRAWIIEQLLQSWPGGDLEWRRGVRGGQSVTDSFSLQTTWYREWLEGISEAILINHKLQLVAEQGWLSIRIESDLQAYSLHAQCTQEAHVSTDARFPFWLFVAAADYQIVKEQSNSLCVWCIQQASGG